MGYVKLEQFSTMSQIVVSWSCQANLVGATRTNNWVQIVMCLTWVINAVRFVMAHEWCMRDLTYRPVILILRMWETVVNSMLCCRVVSRAKTFQQWGKNRQTPAPESLARMTMLTIVKERSQNVQFTSTAIFRENHGKSSRVSARYTSIEAPRNSGIQRGSLGLMKVMVQLVRRK
mmetsp:Transcript_37481/g.99621  ORF Transcript_37481/g.99621 Transcript_37481/m.99621 type:complete len:175 (+) Transcript_37481:1-525(+)